MGTNGDNVVLWRALCQTPVTHAEKPAANVRREGAVAHVEGADKDRDLANALVAAACVRVVADLRQLDHLAEVLPLLRIAEGVVFALLALEADTQPRHVRA